MHHAWTESVLTIDYQRFADRPFLLRDPLIDAQKDRAALLTYIAELEQQIADLEESYRDSRS